MKKYNFILVFTYLIGFYTSKTFSQETLSILNIDISIPSEQYFISYQNGKLDTTSGLKNAIIHGFKYDLSSTPPTDSFRTRVIDSFYFRIGLDVIYPNYVVTVSFLLDTFNRELHNFVWGYSEESTPSYPQSGSSSSITFSPMNYYLLGDTLFAFATGNDCQRRLINASHSSYYTSSPNFTYSNSYTKRIRYEDTIEFYYKIK